MRSRKIGITVLALAAMFGVLAVAASADAAPVTKSLSEFAIFSGGNLSIGGHNLVNGDVGSNGNVDGQGNTQLNGSVYAGGNFTPGSTVHVGSNGVTAGPDLDSGTRFISIGAVYPALSVEVVVNGSVSFGGDANPVNADHVYGNVYTKNVTLSQNAGIEKVAGLGGNLEYTGSFSRNGGAHVDGLVNGVSWGPAITGSNPAAPAALGSTKTFAAVTLPTPTSFSAGVTALSDPSGTVAPGHWAALTTTLNHTVNLTSGDYYFSSINTGGGLTLNIDLTSGLPINLYVVGNATFGQDTLLQVKGAGTGGVFVPLSQASDLATLINWETHGKFILGGGNTTSWTTIFGGTVYSTYFGTGDGLTIGQRVDWYGALYAVDSANLADHSRFTYVSVPEPASLTLLVLGGLGLAGKMFRRRTR
ncbi:MAG: hypothetical protein BIFFINMI_00759 [Phycisphaerae bacterium]|nr:hypothetical protein [Phycisphaerae bacterium]